MARIGDALEFRAQFYSVIGDVLTGATVTVNIRKPDLTLIVPGGSASEIGTSGVYRYNYASSDAVGRWQAQFATTNSNADLLKVTVWIDVDVAEMPINDDAILAAVGSPMQASAYTAPDNATITAIDGKIDDVIDDIYALTHTEAGDPISRVIPLPESADTCVLYEYCYDIASAQPLASVTATAQISDLPYDYAGKLHAGAIIAGTYNAVDGLVSWEIVQGATVTVNIKEVAVLSRITIPAAVQARVFDLLTP